MPSARHAGEEALDCSRPRNAVFWFGVGVGLALVVMSASARGNWVSLLRVGSANPLLAGIERDLGPAAGTDPTGHDGQIYYLIARDPLGLRGTPEAIAAFDNNGPRYRYRRILFPLLAGGFGQFNGQVTLFGMILWLVAGSGLAALAVADLCFQLNLRGAAALAALLNAGALASLLFLTADVLALALTLAGIALVLRDRLRMAVVLFALATLVKETYLLVPLSAAAWLCYERRSRQAWTFAAVPAVPLAAWSLWLSAAMPGPALATRNLGAPFQGMSQALIVWIELERNPAELFLIAFITAALGAASAGMVLGGNRLLRWTTGPWLALAVLAALPVWGKPNNAARAFAILWPLAVLLLGERYRLLNVRTTHK